VLAALLVSSCGTGRDDAMAAARSEAEAVAAAARSADTHRAEPDLPSPQQLARGGLDALVESPSVHISGVLDLEGTPTELDVRVELGDAAAEVTTDAYTWNADGFEVVIVGGQVYARGTAGFLARNGLPPSDAAAFAWRWAAMPATADGEFRSTMHALQRQLTAMLEDAAGAVAEEARLGSEPAYMVTLASGARVYTAVTEPGYLLAVVDAEGNRMDFTEYRLTQGIAAPPDPLDLTQIGG
jgi:hypothetical protein